MLLIKLWNSWTTPTTNGELAQRRERVLLTTLAGLFCLSLLTQAIQWISVATNHNIRIVEWWTLNAAFGAACYALLRLARAGWPRLAASCLLTALAIVTLIELLADGVINPMPIMLLAVLLLLATILLGARATMLTVISAAIALIAVAQLQHHGTLPLWTSDAQSPINVGTAIALAALMGFMGIVLWLYTRDVLVSIDQAIAHSNPNSPLRQLRTKTLTIREIEVVQLVADGLSNQQIAQRLFLSPRTVQTHVANAMQKSGCANRTELGVLAIREGLVPLQEPDTDSTESESTVGAST